MANSRTENAKRNIVVALASQVLLVLFAFSTRTIFINYIGLKYLGLSNVLSSIITIMSIAELGIGEAIAFSLYKPLSENDTTTIRAIMLLFKKIYRIIALTVFTIGILLLPMLKYIIKDSMDIDNFYLIYLIYVINSVSGYLFSYKRTLLIADQKKYIENLSHTLFLFIMYVMQVVCLIISKNFLLYLIIQVGSSILENVFLSYYVDKNYSYLKYTISEDESERIDKKRIYKNFYALAIQRLNGVIAQSIDNVVLSVLLGTIIVGKYSNYMTIEKYLTQFLTVVYTALSGSIGNLIASEPKEKHYDLFKKINFITFWLFSLTTICYFVGIQPFMRVWLKGSEYQLDIVTVFFISINYYLLGVRHSVTLFKNAYGLYWQDRYKPIVAAVVNVIFSVGLTSFFGPAGVAIGTTIAYLFINATIEPYVLFKYGFNRSSKHFFTDYLIKLLIVVSCMVGFYAIMIQMIFDNYLLIFLLSMLSIVVVYNICAIVLSHKTVEYKYLKNLLCNILGVKRNVE